jgi:predicted nuclease with TOPRIM domain
VESKDKSIGELSAEIHNLLTQKTLMPSEIYEFKIKTELKSLELNQMSHKKQTLEAQTDSKDLEVKKQSQTLETTKTELESKITNLNNELKRKSLDLSQAREKIALLEGQIFSKETEIQEMSRTIAQKDSIHSEEKESLKRVVEDAQRNANTFKENFNDSILRIQVTHPSSFFFINLQQDRFQRLF